MKKILCIHNGQSYLPEIEAYKKYFTLYNIQFIDAYHDLNNNYNEEDFDLLWYMLGTDFKKSKKTKVHEYLSLSIGKLSFLKDIIKKYFNSKPELRIFLNNEIKEHYNFDRDDAYLIRDMGIDKIFFKEFSVETKYNFVYLGAISKDRNTIILLDKFKNDLKKYTLLLIGSVPTNIYEQYNSVPNIIFKGKVKHDDVPKTLLEAEYAINMIPNKYPYNIQTSTKLLEYCALNMKIITTEYIWLEDFQKQRNARFYKVNESLADFNPEELVDFKFRTPCVRDLVWEKIFQKINLIENVKKIIN